jgi:predicted nuclease with TOPRIM domain
MEKQQSESKIVQELSNILYNMKASGNADVRELKTIAEAIDYLSKDDNVAEIEKLKKENTMQSYKIYLLNDDKRQLEKDNYRLLKDNRNLQEEVSSLRKRCGIDVFKEM